MSVALRPLDREAPLHIFCSVSPPHWQWPAPMGSWRVTHCQVQLVYVVPRLFILGIHVCGSATTKNSFHVLFVMYGGNAVGCLFCMLIKGSLRVLPVRFWVQWVFCSISNYICLVIQMIPFWIMPVQIKFHNLVLWIGWVSCQISHLMST